MRPISSQKQRKKETNKNPAPTQSEVLSIGGEESGINSGLGSCQVNIMKGEKARVFRVYVKKVSSDGAWNLSWVGKRWGYCGWCTEE